MEKIRIKNFRGFKDTGYMEIKSLTVAVGKNSSGKSTIIRTFPLFKQTFETKVSEPILWYGRYVDFGDYKQVKNNEASDDENISFEFKFTILAHRFEERKNVNVEISLNEREIESVTIKRNEDKINIIYGEKNNVCKILINDVEISTNNVRFTREFQDLIPMLYDGSYMNRFNTYGNYINYHYFFDDIEKVDSNSLMSIVKEFDLKKYIKNYDEIYRYIVQTFAERTPSKDNVSVFVNDICKRTMYIEGSEVDFKKYIMDKIKSNYDLMVRYTLTGSLNSIISECNRYFYNYFHNVNYIAPIRANAERYYRIQGLNIEDVDCRGENIPMILKNMPSKEKEEFKKWVKKKFGFYMDSKYTEGHISLYVYESEKSKKINIADTGFGNSQILPIIVLLWKSKNSNKNISKSGIEIEFDRDMRIQKMIVIEQPELHLHPKMQIQLIKVIIEILRENHNIKFFLETHSEIIINYIGRVIEEKKFDKERVNVLLVEQPKEYMSTVRSVKYSDEGYLREWPLDFFTGEEWFC